MAGDLKRLIKKTAEQGKTLDEPSIWSLFYQVGGGNRAGSGVAPSRFGLRYDDLPRAPTPHSERHHFRVMLANQIASGDMLSKHEMLLLTQLAVDYVGDSQPASVCCTLPPGDGRAALHAPAPYHAPRHQARCGVRGSLSWSSGVGCACGSCRARILLGTRPCVRYPPPSATARCTATVHGLRRTLRSLARLCQGLLPAQPHSHMLRIANRGVQHGSKVH